MAKKRKAATKKRETSKPMRKRRVSNPDTTVNTLVVLVVIAFVLGGLYFYAQNKKQIALFPALIQSVAALITPSSTMSPPIDQPAADQSAALAPSEPPAQPPSASSAPAALPPSASSAPAALPPSASSAPAALPTPLVKESPEITGSVQKAQTTASAKARQPALGPHPVRPTTQADTNAPIALVPSQDH